jgi:hypothetical protein
LEYFDDKILLENNWEFWKEYFGNNVDVLDDFGLKDSNIIFWSIFFQKIIILY